MAVNSRTEPMRLVVLISGNGSNLQAIIDASALSLNVKICAVISNRPGVYGLQRAAKANIPHHTIDHKSFANRESFDVELKATIDSYNPDLVVLAGFMRVLTDDFVRSYRDRMLNIHPSLLPKYRGLNTHAKAIAAGDSYHGASVHFVTETLDGGPVIVQARVPIIENDTVESLAQRVQNVEHRIYIKALEWLCHQRLVCQTGQLSFDGEPLLKPLIMEANNEHELQMV